MLMCVRMTKLHYVRLFALSTLFILCMSSASVHAQAKKAPNYDMDVNSAAIPGPDKSVYADIAPKKCHVAKGKFDWNFEKAKMSDVVEQISQLTCKNFIIPAAVRPTQEISILSRSPVTVDQAWAAFQGALESNDVALVKTGDFYKLIKRNQAAKAPLPVISNPNALPLDESMVTYVHEVVNQPKEAVRAIAAKMVSSANGSVDLVGEFLIITDSSQNIKRITSILDKTEERSTAINTIELRYYEPTKMQTKLEEIFDVNARGSAALRAARVRAGISGGDEGVGSIEKIIADDRSNKLFVISSAKAMQRVKEIIDQLDVPGTDSSTQGKLHVYTVNNGDPKDLVASLTPLLQGNKNRPSMRSLDGLGGLDQIEGEVKISADKNNNKLLVMANSSDYRAFLNVMEKLDVPRTKVYVEAVIMEVSINDTTDVNLGAFGAFDAFGQGIGIAMNPGGQQLAAGALTGFASGNPAGLAAGMSQFLNTIGFMGALKTIPGPNGTSIQVPGIGAMLKLLEASSSVDVLSTPSMMTLDNEKTEISVGSKYPVVKSAANLGSGGASGIGIPINNIAYEDVKLTFAVTPHVNDVGEIRLEVDQSVNDVGVNVPVGPNQNPPEILTKSAKTSVVAKDQQTVVIGGLISQKNVTTEQKIPILGDIPIIGWLFKTWKKEVKKSNLMLALTPYIIRNDEDNQKIFLRKQAERQEFIDLYYGLPAFKYEPYLDYDKKVGPTRKLFEFVNAEYKKAENGGPGNSDEIIIRAEPVLEQQISTMPLPNDVSEEIVVTREPSSIVGNNPIDTVEMPMPPQGEVGSNVPVEPGSGE